MDDRVGADSARPPRTTELCADTLADGTVLVWSMMSNPDRYSREQAIKIVEDLKVA